MNRTNVSRQIWLAPILNDNRERLIERASEVLASGPAEALLYIAASRPLLDLAAARLLDGVRNRGVWGSLPVHLFRGFARFVLATAIDEQTGSALVTRVAIDQQELPLKRSLLSQIIKRLAHEGTLKAIAPLAGRDGCTTSVASVIGEIQRAGKTPEEFAAIVDARAQDLYHSPEATATASQATQIPRQKDFDCEIAIIYSAYAAALAKFGLTEDDSDQLRALQALRGEVDGTAVTVPWLSSARLLVIDGFFDFTPVQGEMLRLLIPTFPEVIVNLNRDERNREIFTPFERTIDQLASIAEFEIHQSAKALELSGDLSGLRERLFNPRDNLVEDPADRSTSIKVLDCGNRQTEIRAIAREIKRLVLLDGYRVSEVAVVVREIGAYGETISRVFEEERIACALGRRVPLTEAPSVRAALKLFDLLAELARGADSPKMSELADLIKSGYFSLSDGDLADLRERFERESHHLFEAANYRRGPDESNVGEWDPDELENAIAYVGGELRLKAWLERARHLTARLEPRHDEPVEDEADPEVSPDDEASPAFDSRMDAGKLRAGRFEIVDVPLPGSDRRPKPARELHPALIEWSALVIDRFAAALTGLPAAGRPRELREAMMRLLDRLQFACEVRGRHPAGLSDAELPSVAFDQRGLEGLRRALSAATRSIEFSNRSDEDTPSSIKLSTLLDETIRCVRAQMLLTAGGDRDGVKILEATDIRGLRFRALFIAGLIEGGFPMRASRDWIYPHEERERLKQYGLTLEDISSDALLKEEHYFYQAACRATEWLYLSRPLVLEDGSETVSSYYIEELERAIAPAKIVREAVRSDFDGAGLFRSSRSSELATLLVRQQERHRHRAQREATFPADVIERLTAVACERGFLSEAARRRITIERERGGTRFGRFDGLIGDAKLIDLLKSKYAGAHDFSASELSLYGKCPFKFFVEKMLKLEPRGEAALDLSALDAGRLLHEALRQFFERHRGQRLADLDRLALRRELDEIADAVFDAHERAVPPLNHQVWKIDREIRKLLLEQVLDYELELQEQTRATGVRPAYFELAFGMNGIEVDPKSTAEPLEVRRGPDDRSESARLRGQIDRVDVAPDGTVVAYDYKLSRGAGREDMEKGRALQLHVYLSALEQLFLPNARFAGAGYYILKAGRPRRNQGLYRTSLQEYTAVSERTASSLSEEDWLRLRADMQARVWEFIDGIRAGQFKVQPSAPDESCPHCDFSAVCRYERFRIRRKTAD